MLQCFILIKLLLTHISALEGYLRKIVQKIGIKYYVEIQLRRRRTILYVVVVVVVKKIKLKVTLVQAPRCCISRTAHRGSRGIALL
jgi:hypothetical protein